MQVPGRARLGSLSRAPACADDPGGCVTALADVVSPEARALLERIRELAELDRLVRERGQQRPAPEPVPLHQLAAHDGHADDDAQEGRHND